MIFDAASIFATMSEPLSSSSNGSLELFGTCMSITELLLLFTADFLLLKLLFWNWFCCYSKEFDFLPIEWVDILLMADVMEYTKFFLQIIPSVSKSIALKAPIISLVWSLLPNEFFTFSENLFKSTLLRVFPYIYWKNLRTSTRSL